MEASGYFEHLRDTSFIEAFKFWLWDSTEEENVIATHNYWWPPQLGLHGVSSSSQASWGIQRFGGVGLKFKKTWQRSAWKSGNIFIRTTSRSVEGWSCLPLPGFVSLHLPLTHCKGMHPLAVPSSEEVTPTSTFLFPILLQSHSFPFPWLRLLVPDLSPIFLY